MYQFLEQSPCGGFSTVFIHVLWYFMFVFNLFFFFFFSFYEIAFYYKSWNYESICKNKTTTEFYISVLTLFALLTVSFKELVAEIWILLYLQMPKYQAKKGSTDLLSLRFKEGIKLYMEKLIFCLVSTPLCMLFL